MPGRNDDRQGYRPDINDPRGVERPNELTGGMHREKHAYTGNETRESTPAPSRRPPRRRAELELEQVEKAYMNERQQATAQHPAYPPAQPVRPTGTERRPVQGSLNTAGPPVRSSSYGQAPFPERSRPENPVVPAYPQSEPRAGRSAQAAQGMPRAQGQLLTPQPSYPVSDQGNEIIIDASEKLDAPEQILVALPLGQEFGGQADILNDDDANTDDAAALAKGGRFQAKLSTKRRKKRVGKRRYGVFVGSLVLLLAMVGLVVVFWSGFTWVRAIINDESALIAYDEMIGPVVSLDPQPFENITAADQEMVLISSILAAEYESSESGEYDDYTQNVKKIPVGEVLSQSTRLFGPNCNVPLRSIEDEFNSYTYDENAQEIIAPLNGNLGAYQPYTESSRRRGDSVLLRVGYVSFANYGEANEEGTDVKREAGKSRPKYIVDKYMEYELKTDPQTGQPYIFAIRDLETVSTVSTDEELQ